jgi:hypothetical protein
MISKAILALCDIPFTYDERLTAQEGIKKLKLRPNEFRLVITIKSAAHPDGQQQEAIAFSTVSGVTTCCERVCRYFGC